jgi:glycosyltransferase involved in cell wall biosynthesis
MSNLSEKKTRILFLEHAKQSDGRFLKPIVKSLKDKYNAKYLRTFDLKEVERGIEWADILWLEWANQLTTYVTNNFPIIKKKVICRLHGYEVFTDIPGQINWNRVDRLVFVANHKKELFIKKFGKTPVKKTVIRNGINLNDFTISGNKRNTKKLVLIGYLNFRKGLPILLHFFQQLLKYDSSYRLYIRGEFQDKRLEMATLTMINELNLTNKIEFVGWVKDLNTWLSDKSHILSFSLEESFHYALGDGMAAGLKPLIHAWNESRDIWPNEYIFSNLDDFIKIMKDPVYSPEKYRNLLIEYNLDSKHQLKNIEILLDEVSNE